MLESGAISDIALIFVTCDDFETQMNRALALVGERLDVSRCCLFRGSSDLTTTRKTNEWHAPGIEPLTETPRDIPLSLFAPWKEECAKNGICVIEDISTQREEIREILEKRGVRSLVIVPVMASGETVGFLVLDERGHPREWTTAETEILKAIAGIVSSAFSKQLLSDRLSVSEENFRKFFDTIDDIIIIGAYDGTVVFANGGACRKLGYRPEELTGKPIIELHPPDTREEAARILTAMFRRELDRCPLELMDRNGIRFPVETRVWFGRWNGRDCIFGLSKDLSAEQSALQKFEGLFRNNPVVMALSNPADRRFIDVNNAFLRKFGYERSEVIGRTSHDLGLFFEDERWIAARKELIGTGTLTDDALKVRGKEGNLMYGLFSGDIIRIQGESLLLTVMVDITEQIRLQADLDRERKRLLHVIEGTGLGTWEWNVQTGETTFNQRWAEILGYTVKELEPISLATWTGLCHPEDLKEANRQLSLHFEGKTERYEAEYRMRHRNGSWVYIQDRGKVIERDAEGKPLWMYGTHSDITEKRRMEERILDMAIRDPLTGLYNRRHIFEHLELIAAEYSRSGRNFRVSILDLDHFKPINDSFGHQAGDFILKEFSFIVSSSLRQYDLFGRYGGEEFIIVSAGVGGRETAVMIERIMRIVSEKTFRFEGKEIRFTFSCGIADSLELPRENFSIEELISLADRRLYLAKERGRNRYEGP